MGRKVIESISLFGTLPHILMFEIFSDTKRLFTSLPGQCTFLTFPYEGELANVLIAFTQYI